MRIALRQVSQAEPLQDMQPFTSMLRIVKDHVENRGAETLPDRGVIDKGLIQASRLNEIV